MKNRGSAHRRLAVALLVILAAAACTVGPDYEVPATPVPDAWAAAAAEELSVVDSPLETWWEHFNDAQLTALIERAGLSNLDLQAAVARVEEARALRGVATGERVPQVFVDGSYQRTQPSENSLLPAPPGGFDEASLYDVGLSFSWELDFFGRIRRSVEAATARLEASVEDYRDVLVLLYAEVARAYIDVRELQARLHFARGNARAQEESLELTEVRFEVGLTSGLDVAQAEANLGNTRAAIPTLEIGLEAAMNRLAVLVAEHPGSLDQELDEIKPIPEPDTDLTIGMPADLLRRRPDIRRAERALAAQTALVGVATADLYPTFSLSGVLGVQATSSGDLGDGDSVTWALIPGLRWNIFSGGRVRNRIRVEEARTQQALLAYEGTVLRALEEVENALVAYERERVRRDRLREATGAQQRAVELVETQYKSGLTNFQNFLDAQRSLFQSQDSLAASEGQVVKNLADLSRALGGGWTMPQGDAGPVEEATTIIEEAEAAGMVADPQSGGSER